MTESLHLRPYRAQTVLCGAAAKSVRSTRKVALASCEACLQALQEEKAEQVRLRTEEFVRRFEGVKVPGTEL